VLRTLEVDVAVAGCRQDFGQGLDFRHPCPVSDLDDQDCPWCRAHPVQGLGNLGGGDAGIAYLKHA